jgi:F-type H+-transporting ATPase subunit epsilon
MAESKSTADEEKGVRCVIVTPETTILDTRARFVTLPLFDGQRGVARNHAPFIGRLGAGEIRIVGEQGAAADAVRRFFADGGFVEVGHDAVTIITQRAIPGEKLSDAAARAELDKLRGTTATGDEAIAAKLKALEAARALVRTAERGR